MQNAIQIASLLMLAGVAQATFDFVGCQQTAANHAGDLASALTHSINVNLGFTVGFAKPHYTSLSSACDNFASKFNNAPSDCLNDDFANVFNGFDNHLSDVLQNFCDNANAVGGDDYARQCGNDLWGWYGDIASKWGNIADCTYVDSVWDKHCALTDAFSSFYDHFDCGNHGFDWGDCGAFDKHTSSCKLSTTSGLPSSTAKSSSKSAAASSSSKASSSASASASSSPKSSASTTAKPSGSASATVSTYSDSTTSYRCRVVGSAAGGLA